MYVFKLVTASDRTDTKTEVTRWVYNGNITEQTMECLTDRLRMLFGRRSGQFYISWHDGTDYCTIRDVHDLQEAIKFFAGLNTAEKAVRLFISPDKREHQTIFGEKPDKNTEEEAKPTPIPAAISEASESESSDDEAKDEEELGKVKVVEDQDDIERNIQPETTQEPVLTQQPFMMMHPGYIPPCAPMPYAQYMPYGVPYACHHMCQPPPVCQPCVQPAESEIVQPQPTEPGVVARVEEEKKAPEPQEEKPETTKQDAAVLTSVLVEPEEPKKKKKEHKYVTVALLTLRKMGFTQDEKQLKKLIKKHKGNLNEIIDKLEANSV